MPDLDHTVIRMKLEKLKQSMELGPDRDADVEQKVLWVRSQMNMLVEILLYLGK